MYAEISMSLKSAVSSGTLSSALKNSLGTSAIPAASAVASTPWASFEHQVVGAASFPNGTVVAYLHIEPLNDVLISVQGTSIRQIKETCTKVVKQVESFRFLSVGSVSARLMVPLNGSDTDILTGQKVSWLNVFWESCKQNFLVKLVPALASVGLLIFFIPASPSIASAFIAVAATLVSIVADAAWASRKAESWKWQES